VVVNALGLSQVIGWGSTYYLLAVLAQPIIAEMGWTLGMTMGGFSVGLLAAAAIAPAIGRAIDHRGGRPIMALGSVLIAAGLAGIASSGTLVAYFAAWLVTGFGMGAALYDAAFSTAGRLLGSQARSAITTITLWGGFASTVGWPLTAFLAELLGWRGTCLAYAAVNLIVALPLHLLALPREEPQAASKGASPSAAGPTAARAFDRDRRLAWWLLSSGLTLGAIVTGQLSIHLLTFLQLRGLELAAAVGLAALIGPTQVAMRIVEKLVGARFHPVQSGVVSSLLIMLGVGLLLVDLPIVAVALLVYGAGLGLRSIARGSLPLAIFGASGYPTLMGRLALPINLATALAPTLGGIMIERLGGYATLAFLTAIAAFVLGEMLVLRRLVARLPAP